MAINLTEKKTAKGTAFIDIGAGEPLVLIHGVGLNKQVWEPQWLAFRTRYRVIAYDTLGHGDSPLPGASATLDDYFDQLVELLDSLQIERAHLCGHSMGALITIGFTLRYPHRVNSMMPLMGAYDRTAEHQLRSHKVAEMLSGPNKDSLLKTTLERWFSTADYADEQRQTKIAQVKKWLLQADQVGYSRAYRIFAQNGETYVGKLGRIKAPALFITAELDPNSTPAMSRRMSTEVQNGRVYILSNERHMGQYVAAHAIQAVMQDFLHEIASNEV